jgi:hypothetical protein
MLIRGSDAKERERDSMRRFGCDGRGRVRYNYETGELKVSLIHELDHMAYVEVRTPEPIRDKVAELARSGLTPKDATDDDKVPMLSMRGHPLTRGSASACSSTCSRSSVIDMASTLLSS